MSKFLTLLLIANFLPGASAASLEAKNAEADENIKTTPQSLTFQSKEYGASISLDKDSNFIIDGLWLRDKLTGDDLPLWTDNGNDDAKQAGLKLVSYGMDGMEKDVKMRSLQVKENRRGSLQFNAICIDGRIFELSFSKAGFSISCDSASNSRWAVELDVRGAEDACESIMPHHVKYNLNGTGHWLKLNSGFFQSPTSDHHYAFRIYPENNLMAMDCTDNGEDVEEPLQLNGNRFLTLCFMIRTTPWEVSWDVKLHPRDEASWHTLESVQALREAVERSSPGSRVTWGFTLNALEDERENYKEIRQYVKDCHYKYGDEVSYFPGYFPAMYLPRERINKEMTEAISEITELVGNGYRPKCIMGGFLSAENLKYLSEKENIHVAHACIWSQHAIDGGGADGSISYPYYPSVEHFCKPAQGKADFVDCVNLDGWTCDFICARRSGSIGHDIHGYNSRRGVGPIETYKGWGIDLGNLEVLHTEGIHYDNGYEQNGFGLITNIWETQMYHEFGAEFMIRAMETWIKSTKEKWPDVKLISFGEFGELWRAQHKSNDFDYHFFERGSGLGDSYNNLEIRWFMNPKFRLALLRDWHTPGSPAYVIDFTRYDLKAQEPADATPDKPHKDWSLMNVLNQKQTRPQDKPCLLTDLSEENQAIIRAEYPELFN